MPYERFDAWQSCHQLVLRIYQVTRGFPSRELYGLTAQARRAAFSAAANIAEGSAKPGPLEFGRFLDISIGSLSELAYVLRLSHDLGLLPHAQWVDLDELRAVASRRTWRLYQAVRRNAARRRARRPPDRKADRPTA